jgi:hypothetical protein
METNLAHSQNHNKTLSLTTQTTEAIYETMKMVNHVVQFDFPPEKIASWCLMIKAQRPETTIAELELVITKFLDGRSKWNHKEALPNIFRGLSLLKLEPREYYDEEKGMKYRIYGSDSTNRRRIYENDREF